MSAISSVDILSQLKNQYFQLSDEAYDIRQLLTAATNATQAASVPYFALTPYSDNNDATLVSTAYHTAINNEQPIRLRFEAKVAELNAVKAQLAAARMGL